MSPFRVLGPTLVLLAATLALSVAVARPARAGCPDEDHDGICDAVDPCNGGVPITRSRLRIRKILEPAGNQRVKLKGSMVVATVPPIDPITKGIRMQVRDADGTTILDATVPGGLFSTETRRGWRQVGRGESWSYSDHEGTAGGIKRVSVRHRGGGALKVVLFGQEGSYAQPATLPVTVTLVIDSPMATTGQCAEVTYDDSPGCYYLNQGNKLICR